MSKRLYESAPAKPFETEKGLGRRAKGHGGNLSLKASEVYLTSSAERAFGTVPDDAKRAEALRKQLAWRSGKPQAEKLKAYRGESE